MKLLQQFRQYASDSIVDCYGTKTSAHDQKNRFCIIKTAECKAFFTTALKQLLADRGAG